MSGIVGSKLNIRGSGRVAKLGTDGQVLTSAGAGVSAVYEDAAGGGKLLQVVTATDSTERTTTSSSWVTGSNTLSAAITPSATTSKIYASVCTSIKKSGGQSMFTIQRTVSASTTNLGDSGNGFYQHDAGNDNHNGHMSTLDSPSTTSACTYQVYMKGGGDTATLNYGPVEGSITVFEIGA